WFSLGDEDSVVPPPRHKMALVLWLCISTLSILIYLLLEPVLGDRYPILQIMGNTLVIIVLMTYLIMPFLSRLLQHWLYIRK
ncbi:MAG: antibiotic biosynthesis monooxygenase, partial [Gammaproteobacteria bacterium]